MRPVPMEPRIDFAIVTGDPAKVQDHAPETSNTHKQENGDRAFRGRRGLRVCWHRAGTRETPEEEKEDRKSP